MVEYNRRLTSDILEPVVPTVEETLKPHSPPLVSFLPFYCFHWVWPFAVTSEKGNVWPVIELLSSRDVIKLYKLIEIHFKINSSDHNPNTNPYSRYVP